MSTALQIITGSLQDLGQYQSGEPIPAEESADALSTLNDLVDALNVERHWLYTVARTTKALTASTASYTIGSGGNISIDRPTWITSFGLLDSTSTETSLGRPLSDDEYAAIPNKTQAGTPTSAYYDHSSTSGLGRITLWPVPDDSTHSLVIYAPSVAVAQFADLSTTYTFPTGYRRALRKLLAVELAPAYGRTVPPDLASAAREAKASVKRANVRAIPMSGDPVFGSFGGGWNIDTGTFNR